MERSSERVSLSAKTSSATFQISGLTVRSWTKDISWAEGLERMTSFERERTVMPVGAPWIAKCKTWLTVVTLLESASLDLRKRSMRPRTQEITGRAKAQTTTPARKAKNNSTYLLPVKTKQPPGSIDPRGIVRSTSLALTCRPAPQQLRRRQQQLPDPGRCRLGSGRCRLPRSRRPAEYP